jgi:hypothetical protein
MLRSWGGTSSYAAMQAEDFEADAALLECHCQVRAYSCNMCCCPVTEGTRRCCTMPVCIGNAAEEWTLV